MNVLKLSHGKRSVKTTIVIAIVITLPLLALLVGEVGAPATHEVKITGFAFVPQNLTIYLGDTVMWNNTDPVIHTLWFVYVANGSTYHLSDPIPPNTIWTHTFNDAIKLQYYSFDKLWITGFINVTAEAHDVAVVDLTHSKTPCVPMSTVSQGRTVTIWATVENQGGFPETFNVTAYAVNVTASYTIGTQQVTLNPGENTTLTFVWDTTGYKNGDYTIEVTAVLPGDNDPTDNTFTDGVIRVVTPGDVNGDLCVDVFDKVSVGAAFGANRNATDGKYWHGPPDFPGPCIYCPHYANSDLNNDGTIDVFDKVIVGVNFGQGICP